MRKILITLLSVLVLTSCGVGSYSISSGKADTAAISFVSKYKQPIVVHIDGTEYNVETVKTKTYKRNRNIKHTALNTIKIEPGQHTVIVKSSGNTIFSKKLYISNTEHRIVEL